MPTLDITKDFRYKYEIYPFKIFYVGREGKGENAKYKVMINKGKIIDPKTLDVITVNVKNGEEELPLVYVPYEDSPVLELTVEKPMIYFHITHEDKKFLYQYGASHVKMTKAVLRAGTFNVNELITELRKDTPEYDYLLTNTFLQFDYIEIIPETDNTSEKVITMDRITSDFFYLVPGQFYYAPPPPPE